MKTPGKIEWRGFLLIIGLALGAVGTAAGFEIAITVAPNTINVQSEGTVVTVHTDVPFYDVYAHSVILNGIPIASWKSDNKGFFVAKFVMDAVKDVLTPETFNRLTLLGVTTEAAGSEAFAGVDEVWVVDNVPQGGR